MSRTNIYKVSVDNERMNDVEYIKHLERQLGEIDIRVGDFLTKMDKAVSVSDPVKLLEVYADNVSNLRL